jgi:hypothetical protein
VQYELPGLPGSELSEPGDKLDKLVVGYGDDDQFAAFNDGLHLEYGHTGQHAFDAVAFVVGARRDADECVASGGEGGAQHWSDSSGADDAHPEAAVAAAHCWLQR